MTKNKVVEIHPEGTGLLLQELIDNSVEVSEDEEYLIDEIITYTQKYFKLFGPTTVSWHVIAEDALRVHNFSA